MSPNSCWDKSQSTFLHGSTLSIIKEMNMFMKNLSSALGEKLGVMLLPQLCLPMMLVNSYYS